MNVSVGTLRLALGCLHASGEAMATALAAGVTTFDTARAYRESERMLASVVRGKRVCVVTKGGMKRDGATWRPDGRARSIREDCDASLEALAGVAIDTYLVHAPDPAVPWATTVRALARLAEEKLVANIGVCNVTRRQLDEALEIAPITVVQVSLGAGSDAALRGGVVARCIERGITVMAHSPFGGPKRAAKLARDAAVSAIAKRHGASAHAIVLAALLDLDPRIVVVAGPTRKDTIDDCVRGATIVLTDRDRDELDARFGFRSALHPPPPAPSTGAEVLMVMGIQGSGKSTVATERVAAGWERLNRDDRGGTLSKLHSALDARLVAGATRVVLDNTYTTRVQRQGAIAVARARGAAVRGVWIETSLADAQLNVIERMLEAHGRLLAPREMERARDPTALPPHALGRTLRVLEQPELEEGFTSLESKPFVRKPSSRSRSAVFVAHAATVTAKLEAAATYVASCTHEGGPQRCWCRPPLPGLLALLARAHDIDLSKSTVSGTSAAHERMAASVGARYSQRL